MRLNLPNYLRPRRNPRDIIVLLLEQAKHQQQTVSRIRPCQNHSLAEAALCCCRLHGVRGDHRAGSWEAETRPYSCYGGTGFVSPLGSRARQTSMSGSLGTLAFYATPPIQSIRQSWASSGIWAEH